MLSVILSILLSIILFLIWVIIIIENTFMAVFSLIGVFFVYMCALIVLGVDYLAFLFFIVYLGAISVLFIFVVMTVRITAWDVLDAELIYIPVVLIVGLGVSYYIYTCSADSALLVGVASFLPSFVWTGCLSNIYIIGALMFTVFGSYFLILSVVLLLAIICVVFLNMTKIKLIREWQDASQQLARDVEHAMVVIS